MSDCLFCRVAEGTESAHLVLETPEVVGLLDIRPVFKGHVLVIPRRHVVTLPDLPAGLLPVLFAEVQRVAAAIPDALGAQGTFIAQNNTVSQSVPHLHVHVVPRTKGDGLRGFMWPRLRYDEGEAASYAAQLRRVLERRL